MSLSEVVNNFILAFSATEFILKCNTESKIKIDCQSYHKKNCAGVFLTHAEIQQAMVEMIQYNQTKQHVRRVSTRTSTTVNHINKTIYKSRITTKILCNAQRYKILFK